jgi:hypothetical protein
MTPKLTVVDQERRRTKTMNGKLIEIDLRNNQSKNDTLTVIDLYHNRAESASLREYFTIVL